MDGNGADWVGSGVLAHANVVTTDLAEYLDVHVDAAAALTGRAVLLGLHRRGRISAGGATRLMPTREGWWALTLSRPDDIAAIPALVEADTVPDDPWPTVAHWSAHRDAADVVDRAILLDLPAARLGETTAEPPRVTQRGNRVAPRSAEGLLVADLSSMWAGPLCGQILADAGATVVKVESAARPDGTRAGDQAFYDWVNHGKLSYAVDFDRDHDRLRALLMAADIVIEGSRPGVLARRGLSPEILPGPDGRVWLRISGHGPDSQRAAFGDDAAVAGGLVGTGENGPVFCGDAIADPLTGLESALALAHSLLRGGGEIVEVAMSAVAASYAMLPITPSQSPAPAASPALPPRSASAAALGADNAAVDALVDQRNSVTC